MQLIAKALLSQRLVELVARRQKLSTSPGLALVWVGEDKQTATYIRAKQAMAKKLDCHFFLHHFPTASQQQLESMLDGLNRRQDIDGIVLQLPLPKSLDTEALIQKVNPIKDIDNLSGNSPYDSPTPSSIMALLSYHQIAIKDLKTVVLGMGKLVGGPLAKVFAANNWPLTVIAKQAKSQAENIRQHDLLISATGVRGLVAPEMVHQEMVVVDGSGLDVDVKTIEPLVKKITPTKGAIGPLTVSFLFENLLTAAIRKS
ncbi:MAG: bifunctional 5,10-methylenetetrahydrofolate dehydrogenase/5,10-methenyltetrahydrofolate cyclohydrolase [Patescibacteria group bacterium]